MTSNDEPKYAIDSGWLVEVVNEHTCGAGDGMYGHEPGCGLIPLSRVDDLLASITNLETHDRRIAELEAKLAAARSALAAVREVRAAQVADQCTTCEAFR